MFPVVGVLLFFVLLACQHQYAPDEVMQKTLMQNQTIHSLRFHAAGTWTSKIGATQRIVRFELQEGVLQSAEQQVRARVIVNPLPINAIASSASGETIVDLILLHNRDVLLQPIKIGEGKTLFPRMAKFLAVQTGAWVQLPPLSEEDTTVDPRLLRLQPSVVHAIHDYGIDHETGASLYHYDIALNRDALKKSMTIRSVHGDTESATDATLLMNSDAHGQIWIDTDTFQIRRLIWSVQRILPNDPMSSLQFDLTLSDYDAAPTIEIPAVSHALSASVLQDDAALQDQMSSTPTIEKTPLLTLP